MDKNTAVNFTAVFLCYFFEQIKTWATFTASAF